MVTWCHGLMNQMRTKKIFVFNAPAHRINKSPSYSQSPRMINVNHLWLLQVHPNHGWPVDLIFHMLLQTSLRQIYWPTSQIVSPKIAQLLPVRFYRKDVLLPWPKSMVFYQLQLRLLGKLKCLNLLLELKRNKISMYVWNVTVTPRQSRKSSNSRECLNALLHTQ